MRAGDHGAAGDVGPEGFGAGAAVGEEQGGHGPVGGRIVPGKSNQHLPPTRLPCPDPCVLGATLHMDPGGCVIIVAPLVQMAPGPGFEGAAGGSGEPRAAAAQPGPAIVRLPRRIRPA